MNSDRWQQVNALFQAAQEYPLTQREEFLARACADDADLRCEVAALLATPEQAEAFVAQPEIELAEIEPEELSAGQRIGVYRVERLLGKGGMGIVYLAWDTHLQRQVALKLLPARFTQDRERVRRFQQEARAASALNHPNILTIYEVGQLSADAGGDYYIVSEYVAGKTLRELSQLEGVQLGQALELMIQLTEALATAHQMGIIHRDIKPENVMVRPDGIVKLLDFGLAKLTETRKAERGIASTMNEKAEASALQRSAFSDHPSTLPGLVLGTVAYMSPEQARGQTVDARSDLFSLGTLFYELLTGRKPFQGETASDADALAALLEREPAPLSYFVAGLPAGLERIVQRALAKKVDERYQSATEFGAALKKLKQDLELAAHLRGNESQENLLTMKVGTAALGDEVTRMISQDKPMARPRARWQRSGLIAGTLLVLILALGWFGWRWRASEAVLDSVAVLPFRNAANDAQMDYLPDTITENLIDNLTLLPGLRVRARNTVIAYKGREVDPRQAGRELQVAAVITGQVRWQGDRLLLRVELVDTADGSRLWGDEFQYTRSNLVTVQGEIAREIAAKLQRHVTPADQQQLAKRHSTNSKAYELYAQGRYLYLQYSRESQEKALGYFRQAIAADPYYALAYCGIADVYGDFSGQYLSPREAMPKAREAALKAIELDETLPEAHHSLALVKLWGDWDWAGAEREFKRALELNPNFLPTRIYYAGQLFSQKRFAEALREIRWAREYDPVSLQAIDREASIYYYSRQYERALATYQKILELDPRRTEAHLRLGLVYLAQGMMPEALTQAHKAQTPNATPTQRAWLAYLLARAGQQQEALKLLQELESQARRERISPSYFARIHMGLGNKEQALLWLRKVYEEQSDHILIIGVDPIYDPLRDDLRFTELLRGIGLAP